MLTFSCPPLIAGGARHPWSTIRPRRTGGVLSMTAVDPDKMGISFTCGNCETRVSKFVKKHSYNKGVVIIECPSCKSRHLIADNLGWYKDWTGTTMGNIEQLADKMGQKVIRVDPSQFSLEDGAEDQNSDAS